MKKNELTLQHGFKKINENINLKTKVIFSNTEKNIVFYSSNNLIISYDISTSFIVERFRISNYKIQNFFILQNFIFALDNSNEFIKFDMEKKLIEKTLKLKKIFNNLNYSFFKYSKYLNSFIFVSENFDLTKIDFDLNEETLITINLSNLLDTNFRNHYEKNENNKKIRFLDIDLPGKNLIFSINKNAFVINLMNNLLSNIEFQKPVSTGLFLDESKFVLGDISGKTHFVSNFHEEKPFISTSHWHSHKITSLEKDFNNEYLYSGGEEGVVVIWNLKSELKTFLPRLGSEIMTISFTSQRSNILALTLKENSIKFVNLFDSSFICEISGISLNKNLQKNLDSSSNCENFLKTKINKNKYMMIFNSDIGKIQFVNTVTGKIISNLSLILKNFASKTEKENINLRKLKLAEMIKPQNEILVTYEEINLDENVEDKNNNKKFLISVLKFWKILDFTENNFTLELISLAENPHNNESINGLISHDNKMITFSDTLFKVWDLSDVNKQNCIFMGGYRKEKINSVVFSSINSNQIFTLHKNKYLVSWDMKLKEITNVYSFGDKFIDNLNEKEKSVLLISDTNQEKKKKTTHNKILIKSKNTLVLFNSNNQEIEYENNFSELNNYLHTESSPEKLQEEKVTEDSMKNPSLSFEILKAEFSTIYDKEVKTYVRFISRVNENTYLVIRFNINKGICDLDNFFYVKRMFLRHINFKNDKVSENDLSLLIINSNLDILITKREFDNNLLKVKVKRNTIDEEPAQDEEKNRIVDNFNYYKFDENKNKLYDNQMIIDNDNNGNYSQVKDLNEENDNNRNNQKNKDVLQDGLKKLKIKK